MNRRQFLFAAAASAAAAVFHRSGLVVPNKVVKLPERWDRLEQKCAIAAIDPHGKIVAAARPKIYTDPTEYQQENPNAIPGWVALRAHFPCNYFSDKVTHIDRAMLGIQQPSGKLQWRTQTIGQWVHTDVDAWTIYWNLHPDELRARVTENGLR